MLDGKTRNPNGKPSHDAEQKRRTTRNLQAPTKTSSSFNKTTDNRQWMTIVCP